MRNNQLFITARTSVMSLSVTMQKSDGYDCMYYSMNIYENTECTKVGAAKY